MKKEGEKIRFRNQSSCYKIFIAMLFITWLLNLIHNVLNFSVIHTTYSTIKRIWIIFDIVIIFLGIYGYLSNKRNLSLFFLFYYFTTSIIKLVQFIISFISLTELYPFNQMIMTITGFTVGIILRFVIVYFAYKFLPIRKKVY